MKCTQCDSETPTISGQGDVAYRCRCGVVGKWWMGDCDDDGPPQTAIDLLESELIELKVRCEAMAQVLENAKRLRLDDDGEHHDRLLMAMRDCAENANLWLKEAERRAWRFFEGPGDFELLGRPPLDLIDAGREIDRIVKGVAVAPSALAPELLKVITELRQEHWARRRKGPLV